MAKCGILGRAGFFLAVLTALSAGCGGGGGGSPPGSNGAVWTTFQPASLVLGQPDFASDTANQGGAASATTVNYPKGLSQGSTAGSLWVTDTDNNRVLRIPTPLTSPLPDLVVGQPDFTTTTPDITGARLRSPRGACEALGMLAVCDTESSRILIWDPVPTTNGASANVVVGQTDFTSNTTGTTASTLDSPDSVCIVGGRLLVSDYDNNRVLIWNTVPTGNGEPADLVLGQPDFTSSATSDAASGMRRPRGLWSDGTRLLVADYLNHRVLIWTSFPTSDAQPADLVLGQPGFNSSASGTSATSLFSPAHVDSDGTRLVVSDNSNSRVLIWNTFPTSNGQPADVVLGQGDFNHGRDNDDDQDGVSGSPTARTLDYPGGLFMDGPYLYLADEENSRLLVYVSP